MGLVRCVHPGTDDQAAQRETQGRQDPYQIFLDRMDPKFRRGHQSLQAHEGVRAHDVPQGPCPCLGDHEEDCGEDHGDRDGRDRGEASREGHQGTLVVLRVGSEE